MKKFRVVLLAMLLVAILTSTAFAASISSVSYKDGYVSFTVNGIAEGETLYTYVDGQRKAPVDADNPSVRIKMTLNPGTHYAGFSGDKNHISFEVKAAATPPR